MTSPGFISLSAITVLASPRPIDPQKGIRNIVFDANFFIVDGSHTSTLGLLRYFVPENMVSIIQSFSEFNFHKAFINANVHFLINFNMPFFSLIFQTFPLDLFNLPRHLF
jgi:hypothetical protein